MIVQTSEFPGSHERHLLRKAKNPLFEEQQAELNDETLLEAQRLDHELLLEFIREFRSLLHNTSALEGNVESDKVLAVKDRLDRAYETAAAVADKQTNTKQAIAGLLQTVMSAVRLGAGDDPQAQQELDQEDAARDAHFKLLESQLVADLLNPESVITAKELVPTLLSVDKNDLSLAVQLFDPEQLGVLVEQSRALLERVPFADTKDAAGFEENIVFIQGYIEFLANYSRSPNL